MRFVEADIIEIKHMDCAAIPLASELRKILLYTGNATPQTCAIALIASQIMRPVELAYLEWDSSFTVDIDLNRITKIQHPCYKAKSRVMKSNKVKITYPMLTKPMFSKWTSDQLLKYRAKYGDCQYNKVFPWKNGHPLTRFFSRLRQLNPFQLPFICDPTNEILKGQDKTAFRINPYSFRRFGFTFHYWVTFKQDIVRLCEFAGHTDIATTWEYIYPKEKIGLTQEMIDMNITWDQFVLGIDLNQTKLKQFEKQQEALAAQLPRAPGQRTMLHYMNPREP